MKTADDSSRAEEYSIIKACLNGRTEEYSVLVERYRAMVYNVAYRLLGDADAANDVAQDSFISAYLGLQDFRYGAKFSSWLYRIVLNKCRDHLRTNKNTVPVEDIADIMPAATADPEQTTSSRQTGDEVQAALDAMPAAYREVIILKHMEGLDYEEIAVLLGETVGALKVRAHRGREMMREILKKMGAEA